MEIPGHDEWLIQGEPGQEELKSENFIAHISAALYVPEDMFELVYANDELPIGLKNKETGEIYKPIIAFEKELPTETEENPEGYVDISNETELYNEGIFIDDYVSRWIEVE